MKSLEAAEEIIDQVDDEISGKEAPKFVADGTVAIADCSWKMKQQK